MGADDDEQQRQLRAEARRARMTVVRTRLGHEPAEPGPFGLEGMILAAKLSFAAVAFAGQPVARTPRTAIEVRWVRAR
ncbi:MAG: hypothetical protein HOO96_08705 [Polyangiaceae bacterium]|nr:hypothetical protein [Polyangiaceae bacterium]